MGIDELKALLQESPDKLSVLSDKETLKNYTVNQIQLVNLFNELLTDEEITKVLDLDYVKNFYEHIRADIVMSIKDEKMKLDIIREGKLTEGISSHEIKKIVKEFSEKTKIEMLKDNDLLEKAGISSYDKPRMINELSDEGKVEILSDETLVRDKLELSNFDLSSILVNLKNEEQQKHFVEKYEFKPHEKVDVIKTYSDATKADIMANDDSFRKRNKIDILATLSPDSLKDFIKNNKEFFAKNEIHPYSIITRLGTNSQLEMLNSLEDMDLTQDEKREILASLKEETKEKVDRTNLSEEYKKALDIKTSGIDGKIEIDFSKDLEDYRGLDNMLDVKPRDFNEEERKKFLELCDICPDLRVMNTLNGIVMGVTGVKEYKETEAWIEEVVSQLKPEYSDIQKVTVIDNAIGKKISYSPDIDTEEFDPEKSRNLWDIVSSGYGICNGIANVEKYIFDRVGIASKEISGGSHAFLKLENIELPTKDGKTVIGNTILDPTWNLTEQRFGAKPSNFCISYEEARSHDIDQKGNDHTCHKNDEELGDATLSLDDESLREVFASVGLAGKDGKFPIKHLMDKTKDLHEAYKDNPEEDIQKQFELLAEVCPEFASCQNSTTRILQDFLLSEDYLDYEKCVVDRVYDRENKEGGPVIYVYMDSNDVGRKFYCATKEGAKFEELSEKEFVEKYECYEEDLEKAEGKRPWETKEAEIEKEDFAKNEKKMVAQEEIQDDLVK